jgi:hypothetical protein
VTISETIGLVIALVSLVVTLLGFGSDGVRAWVLDVPTYSEMIWRGLKDHGHPDHVWAVVWTVIILAWVELLPTGLLIPFLT